MTVVAVLMTSCHVSEKRKIGPETSHKAISATAATNAAGPQGGAPPMSA
jgi:hypothetical protein